MLNLSRLFFGTLIIPIVLFAPAVKAGSGMPMAKPPSDSRLESYSHLRHQLNVQEMAGKFQISPDLAFKELSEANLSLPLDSLRDRAAYYKEHLLTQHPVQMAKSLGITPAQVYYELRMQKLTLAPYLLDPLPTSILQEVSHEMQTQSGSKLIQFPSGTNRWTILQSTLRNGQLDELSLSSLLKISPELIDSLQSYAHWQNGMPASAWDQQIVFKAEPRIRSELLVELTALGYELDEISDVLNRNTPVTNVAHLLPKMIEERIRNLQIKRTPIPALNAKSLLPMQLSNSDRESFALKKVFEFAKSQKRLPQKQDFFDSESSEPKVALRYSEFIMAFGTQSRAWMQVKERKQEFEKWMGRLPSVRLLDVDFESNPGEEVRKKLQEEVILEFSKRMTAAATGLPSREMILNWIGVPYEALNATDEYSFGGNLYGLRIFDSREAFQAALKIVFPQIEFPKMEAHSVSTQEAN